MEKPVAVRAVRAPVGFPVLLSIGVLDSATRMGFLTFLPFVLAAKGASLPTVGLALTLVFAGGAAGKLVCAFIGARIGMVATVCADRRAHGARHRRAAAAAARMSLVLLPLIGVALNGTSSVLYGSVPELVAPETARRARSASSIPARSAPARSRRSSTDWSAMRSAFPRRWWWWRASACYAAEHSRRAARPGLPCRRRPADPRQACPACWSAGRGHRRDKRMALIHGAAAGASPDAWEKCARHDYGSELAADALGARSSPTTCIAGTASSQARLVGDSSRPSRGSR